MGRGSQARDERPRGGPGGREAQKPQVERGRSAAGASDLDRVIHERVRLGIVSALAVNDTLTFNALKELLGATDGNLSVHARKLEDAGYVVCRKGYEGRIPKTEFALTAAGRRALERYLSHMEALIETVRAG